MNERYSLQRLRALRKLTRAIADELRAELKEHFGTVALLLRPRTVLGDYVESGIKGDVKGAEVAFRDLKAKYEAVAGSRPYGLSKDLGHPIEIVSSNVELTPLEYPYVAKSGGENRTIAVTQPMTWVVSYQGLVPMRIRELLTAKTPDVVQVKELLVHALVLDIVLAKQPGLMAIFEALRCPIGTQKLPGLGELPVTFISSSIKTVRPPDEVLIESTEISGLNAFEEVVNVEDITGMKDPFRDRLLGVLEAHAPDLLK